MPFHIVDDMKDMVLIGAFLVVDGRRIDGMLTKVETLENVQCLCA